MKDSLRRLHRRREARARLHPRPPPGAARSDATILEDPGPPPHDPGQPRLPRTVALVAVDFDLCGRAALQGAAEIAGAMGLSLELVHVIPEQVPFDPLFPQAYFESCFTRPALLLRTQRALQRYAHVEVGLEVPLADIHVDFGELEATLLQLSRRREVAMVVLASAADAGRSGQSERLHRLLRDCPRPLLVVGPRSIAPRVVAATDFSEPSLPVVQQASAIASALGNRLAVVHNIQPGSWGYIDGIGVLTSPQLADQRVRRGRDWLKELHAVGDMVITRKPQAADGVLDTARELSAQLLVVGVKHQQSTLHCTADAVLDGAHRSVLFVPVPRPRTRPRTRPQLSKRARSTSTG